MRPRRGSDYRVIFGSATLFELLYQEVRFHDILTELACMDQGGAVAAEPAPTYAGGRVSEHYREIVRWLRVVLANNADAGEPTIAGIGDDCQSIYG